jgi:hypothetical protein
MWDEEVVAHSIYVLQSNRMMDNGDILPLPHNKAEVAGGVEAGTKRGVPITMTMIVTHG